MRTAHFIDIENLCGAADLPDASGVADQYRTLLRVSDQDQIVVGVSTAQGAFIAADAFPGAHIVVRLGRDGADNALIDFARDEISVLTDRFDLVVIGSGDHAFTDLAHDLTAAGLPVAVASMPRCLSAGLAHVADTVIDLADPADWAPAA